MAETPEAERTWQSVIRCGDLEYVTYEPKHGIASSDDIAPQLFQAQTVEHKYLSRLCMVCAKGLRYHNNRHPVGLAVCIGGEETNLDILRRFSNGTLALLIFLLEGQKLIAPAVYGLILNDMPDLNLPVQSYFLTKTYRMHFHFTGWTDKCPWSQFGFQRTGTGVLPQAATQFKDGFRSNHEDVMLFLTIIGLYWGEEIFAGISAEVIPKVVAVLDPNSKARREFKELSVFTAEELKEGNFPKDELVLKAEYIEKLLRVGACLVHSKSNRVSKKGFDQIIKTFINVANGNIICMDRLKDEYDAPSYHVAGFNHGGIDKRPELAPDDNFIKIGNKLLGPLERGTFTGCRAAIYHHHDRKQGSHGFPFKGYRNYLGLDEENGTINVPYFRARVLGDTVEKHEKFSMKELWEFANLMDKTLKRPHYFPLKHHKELYDTLIAFVEYFTETLVRDGTYYECSQPALFLKYHSLVVWYCSVLRNDPLVENHPNIGQGVHNMHSWNLDSIVWFLIHIHKRISLIKINEDGYILPDGSRVGESECRVSRKVQRHVPHCYGCDVLANPLIRSCAGVLF